MGLPGVLKTYKLTYESTEVMHAVFDSTTAPNRWSISSRLLKDFVEHFGPKTEQLDIYSENGRATFTSYTEKIMDGKGMVLSMRLDLAESLSLVYRGAQAAASDVCRH